MTVETWIPFQMKWNLDSPEQDGTITAYPFLRSLDARSVSDRKMIVSADVGVFAQARVEDNAQLYKPQELPEDVCVKMVKYPMKVPAEAGEKVFTLEEQLNTPIPIESVLYYKASVKLAEQKLLTDKLVFRGMLQLHMLYQGADSANHTLDVELPFSQYVELKQDYPDQDCVQMVFAVTELDVKVDAEGKPELKAGILAQYVLYTDMLLEVAEDAYSISREMELQYDPLKLPAVLDVVGDTISVTQNLSDLQMDVIDAVFYPDIPSLYQDENGLAAALSGQMAILGTDMEGKLQSVVRNWDGEKRIPADRNVGTELYLFEDGHCKMTGKGAETQLNMQMYLQNEKELQILQALTLGEDKKPDAERPSLILCRAGSGTLWDMAKRNGSTEEAIRKANGLSAEPEEGKLLLIPVM